MTGSTYLLEVGTEELPSGFLETCAGELKHLTQDALEKAKLSYGDIRVLQTPRRLALFIDGLASSQADSEEVLKGPPVSVALDANGHPTPAGLGFAKKVGVDFSQLIQETIDGTPYMVYRRQLQGRTSAEVLPEILPDVVLSLSGSHFMVWDSSDVKFSRPIRWLVSMLDKTPVSVTIGLQKSGQITRGHRFFAKAQAIEIPSVEQYQQTLAEKGLVIVDQAVRRQRIQEGLANVAASLKGVVPENPGLLDTVTMLVESPHLVYGSFAPEFLALPKEVITTVMAAHQKYFSVEDASGNLMPYFITISNNPTDQADDMIRHGNEKVLRARLEDASFFFQEDRKRPFSDYVAQLQGVTFQKGLGSLLDKTNRLKTLVAALAPGLGLDNPSLVTDAVRAAELCKADLVTNMVRELTELQGVMGKHYAQLSGEKPDVAIAIAEHYQPRFMGDAVASSRLGIILSLADKLDTMVAVFSQKDARYPTGSKDPMGLRRMALGILLTILDNKIVVNLDEALGQAYDNLGALAQESRQDTLERTTQFLLQRFKGYLLDQNYSYDTIDAVLESDISPFANLADTVQRLGTLKQLQQDVDLFKSLYEPANRISRILGKAYNPTASLSQVNGQLFKDDSERVLFDTVQKHAVEALSFEAALAPMRHWAPAVEAFFDNVMVNVDDAAVKANRYVLLSALNRSYRQYADFTKLVV